MALNLEKFPIVGKILKAYHLLMVGDVTRRVLTEERDAMGSLISLTLDVATSVPCCVVTVTKRPQEAMTGGRLQSDIREIVYFEDAVGILVLPGDTITINGRDYTAVMPDDNQPSAGGIVGIFVVRKQ